MAPIGVDRRRRLLVDRQLLDASGRAERGVGDVAAALGLLHSTDPSTPYLSIHARSDATVADIDEALYGTRSLVRQTTIRRTVFVMSHDVAACAHGAANPPIVDRLRSQLVAWLDASDDVDGPAATFLQATEDAVVSHLRVNGPASGTELADALPSLRVRFDPMPGKPYSRPTRITSKVLEILGAERRITRARPVGNDFTSGAWTWAAFDDWYGSVSPAPVPDDALDGLLTRYLESFGPATVTDMTWWTGLTKTKIRASLRRAGASHVDLAASPEPGFALPGDDLEPVGRDEPVVALLPGLDSTTMGWKQRAWYVDDAPATGVFDRNGNAGPTIWVDGVVVGVWTQRADGEIAFELLDDVGSDARVAIGEEAERLAYWLGDVRVKWRYPTALTRRLS